MIIAFWLSPLYNICDLESTSCWFKKTSFEKEINDMAYIEMKHSYKRYQVGDTEIVANRDVNFEIEKV